MVMGRLSRGKIADLARAFGKPESEVLAAMRSEGIHAAGTDSLGAAAEANRLPPERLLAFFVR
jgi:hypothetical protein